MVDESKNPRIEIEIKLGNDAMDKTNSIDFQVTWRDLDANGHMANTSYMDYATYSRIVYFERYGFGAKAMKELGLGPIALNDNLSYRREMHMLDTFRIEPLWGGVNEKQTRFIIVNRFFVDDVLSAEVTSMTCWMDLEKRKIVVPPEGLMKGLLDLPKTEDFQEL